MIRFVLCLLVGFWPLMGLAQTYDVQSGEHEDFSRIVILYDNVPALYTAKCPVGHVMICLKSLI